MKSRILCTLGPSSMHGEVIRQLSNRGVDLFRLNLSHTPLESLGPTIDFVGRHTDTPLCLDTDGAQVRCGRVRTGVVLQPGRPVRLTAEECLGTARELSLRPSSVFRAMRPGDLLSVDFNGALLRVLAARDDCARVIVLEGGAVGSNRAVTIEPPPVLPPLTESDLEAIRLGRELGVKHFALSFARRAQDVVRLRRLAGAAAYVISKIESRAGVRNMDAVIAASDAVLIDRGDLSREVPLAHVPMHQKEIIRRAIAANTPAFVATNLLESMITNRRPTIAEANDIINTLMDGAHGLVLAAETSIGLNPVASVDMVLELMRAFEWSRTRLLFTGRLSLAEAQSRGA